ncbi:hypothetical protein GCM10009775_03430 [Microbacterium aoyamense]|uniref:POTRA domain-containing protein n=1 Tax=Microbacterium aoyamense TaxID=344166 RepID=A0ABN2P712_9MICO|nr:hypothetical protein [Microbacterium aoyamense]
MTDRRAIVISLVPVVAAVGLLAGAGVSAAVSAPPTTGAVSAVPLSNAQSAAQDWLIDNAEPGQRILVEPTLVAGLVGAGWAPDDVLTAEDAAAVPWREIAYVAIDPDVAASVGAAASSSVAAASFGDIEVRRVVPEGTVIAAASEQSVIAMRREFGAEISRNPAVEMSTPDRVAFASGRVDARISAVLGALAGVGIVTVTDLPVVPGEEAGTIRQIALGRVGDVPLVDGDEPSGQARSIFDSLSGDYAVDALTVSGTDLVLRFALASETPPD